MKDKAEDLVNKYRMVLMDEDTDCGNEILCTLIAKKCALIAVDEILSLSWWSKEEHDEWQQVKQHIENI